MPKADTLDEIGAEQTERAETNDGEAEVGSEQRPPGNQAGPRTEDRRDEPIGGARVGMFAGQSRKAPGDQQHDQGGQSEDQRNHPADMLGRFLRIEVHRHGGSHPGDCDRDGVPGTGALEQDGRRIDGGTLLINRGTILHPAKLACAVLQVEHPGRFR